MRGIVRPIVILTLATLVAGCVSTPPKHTNNICHIFDEKRKWYKQARKASKRWNIPISTNMAIMYQESRFVAKAKPPRTKILGFIPGPRKSSAYGYSQAKKDTWKWYKKSSGHRGADRNDFDDAIDFIAWYNSISVKKSRISRTNTYGLYLAYHEGHGGYTRGTYKKKKWLRNVAQKVAQRARRYSSQLKTCEKRLNSSGWWFF
ncbi:transglycosylase SLT domain-containing protein [Agarilytica rhodophyticola]|uniref:transglycosylase SLT domain-containing protein n=1 Tax=Agarilytica rhodophyticola TaxID=1737490 RepID=UPI000B346752|nr:transglycosylase SLT domain-containing protein [Agarilytica rhodophyticola]